jgi:MFS family permease
MRDGQERDLTPARAASAALSPPGRKWLVLAILFVVYLFSSMDRTIVSIAGEPIKQALGLADWELGLLNGLAFSVLYVGLGIPLARLADRSHRVRIISACLFFWSAMTALCGVAANFVQLVLFRMGVGVGEAGCLPTSHSLIRDYFPPSLRTTALALFGLGLPLGGLAGMIAGGFIVDRFGWREAFLILGAPGVVLAVIVWLVVREPPREVVAPRLTARVAGSGPDSFGSVVRFLMATPTARHVVIGVTLATLFTSPSIAFLAPYMARSFDLSYTEIGLLLGFAQMGGISLSTLAGGLLADWAGRRDRRWYLWVPAGSLLLGGPLFVLAYSQATWPGLVAFLFGAALIGAAYLPPSYAVLYTLVRPHWRATTAAIVGVMMNLIGLSLGPVLCGLLIDMLNSHFLGLAGHADLAAQCLRGGAGAVVEPDAAALCGSTTAVATRLALILFSVGMLWPAAHFLCAARSLFRDEGRTRAVTP